jgi:hypothetical protein
VGGLWALLASMGASNSPEAIRRPLWPPARLRRAHGALRCVPEAAHGP